MFIYVCPYAANQLGKGRLSPPPRCIKLIYCNCVYDHRDDLIHGAAIFSRIPRKFVVVVNRFQIRYYHYKICLDRIKGMNFNHKLFGYANLKQSSSFSGLTAFSGTKTAPKGV